MLVQASGTVDPRCRLFVLSHIQQTCVLCRKCGGAFWRVLGGNKQHVHTSCARFLLNEFQDIQMAQLRGHAVERIPSSLLEQVNDPVSCRRQMTVKSTVASLNFPPARAQNPSVRAEPRVTSVISVGKARA